MPQLSSKVSAEGRLVRLGTAVDRNRNEAQAHRTRAWSEMSGPGTVSLSLDGSLHALTEP